MCRNNKKIKIKEISKKKTKKKNKTPNLHFSDVEFVIEIAKVKLYIFLQSGRKVWVCLQSVEKPMLFSSQIGRILKIKIKKKKKIKTKTKKTIISNEKINEALTKPLFL